MTSRKPSWTSIKKELASKAPGDLLSLVGDLYRLDDIEESIDLGLDDYFYGEGLSVVEWAEKAISIMPRNRLLIRIDYISDTGRTLLLEPSGERYQELSRQLLSSFTDSH